MREELFHIILGILIPFLGTTIGAGLRIFCTEGDQAGHPEDASGICLRHHGGCFGVVASDPSYGDVRVSRKAGLYPGGSGLFHWYAFFVDVR